jgi:hypothetical protein
VAVSGEFVTLGVEADRGDVAVGDLVAEEDMGCLVSDRAESLGRLRSATT